MPPDIDIDLDLDRQIVRRIDGVPATPRSGGLHSMRPMGVNRAGSSSDAQPRLTIERTTLTAKQRNEADRDPQQEVASIMPVALVNPLEDAAADVAALAAAKAAGASWGIDAVGATPAADPKNPNGRNVVVAVLDTGIKKDHPAFRNITSWQARNFVKPSSVNDPEVDDPAGHGTHAASTIFGADVDGVRIGVAPGVTSAVIGRVLDKNGNGTNEAVLEALKWAASSGAHVVSMSLGFNFSGMVGKLEQLGWPREVAISRTLKAYLENVRIFDKLVDYLNFDGRILLAASGNNSIRGDAPRLIDVLMPAATEHVISVGAIQKQDMPQGYVAAPFSNINPSLCAPGVGIVGASHLGSLVAMSGTSMACPHVAGLAALWRDHQLRSTGRSTVETVRESLGATCKDIGLGMADQGRGLARAPIVVSYWSYDQVGF